MIPELSEMILNSDIQKLYKEIGTKITKKDFEGRSGLVRDLI